MNKQVSIELNHEMDIELNIGFRLEYVYRLLVFVLYTARCYCFMYCFLLYYVDFEILVDFSCIYIVIVMIEIDVKKETSQLDYRQQFERSMLYALSALIKLCLFSGGTRLFKPFSRETYKPKYLYKFSSFSWILIALINSPKLGT